MPAYDKLEYWSKRYTTDFPEPFDWLVAWKDLKEVVDAVVPNKASRILILGCGNAPFSPEMWEAGYQNLVNIDLCEEVIDLQQQRHPQLVWKVMDARDLQFSDESFDVVVDKSTIDTLMCFNDGKKCVHQMLLESRRVLRPGGRYICISLHSEEEVLEFVTAQDWGIRHCSIRNPKFEELPSSTRAVSHSLLLCEKRAHPAVPVPLGNIPALPGALSEEELKALRKHAASLALEESLSSTSTDEVVEILSQVLEEYISFRKVERMRQQQQGKRLAV